MYVDFKLCLLSTSVIHFVGHYVVRPTLWNLPTTPFDNLLGFVLLLIAYVFLGVILTNGSRSDKRLRIINFEYFNLLNKIHEGVIVLGKSKKLDQTTDSV